MNNFLTLYLKEWKQTKGLFLICLFVLLIFNLWRDSKITSINILATNLSILIPIVIGANIFAVERKIGTSNYLLSLPIKKYEIWFSKFIVGITQIIIIISINRITQSHFSFSTADFLFMFGLFSLGMFFSFIFDKPLVAFLVGILLFVLIGTVYYQISISLSKMFGHNLAIINSILRFILANIFIVFSFLSFFIFTKYRR